MDLTFFGKPIRIKVKTMKAFLCIVKSVKYSKPLLIITFFIFMYTKQITIAKPKYAVEAVLDNPSQTMEIPTRVTSEMSFPKRMEELNLLVSELPPEVVKIFEQLVKEDVGADQIVDDIELLVNGLETVELTDRQKLIYKRCLNLIKTDQIQPKPRD
jgi:hypothetical protein